LFFSTPYDILRVAITAVILYFLLILILRLSGKRTLSSMNAFDFIVNVAIGTALASTILNSMVALSDGLTALVVLIGLQFLISYASSRSKKFSRFTKSEPKLLCYRGELLKGATKQERIADSEILQALRSSGYSSIGEVDAVVLESNGNISVIKDLEGKLPGVKS
jgi:uncharacterized membrane protein YcaP (DUF421 family)